MQMGYRQGGASGLGLRRMLVDEYGNHKQILETNQHKNIASDRVILVSGPHHEVDTVLRIYNLYVREKLSVISIVKLLNSEGITTDRGTVWTDDTITSILQNEKYIGNNIYNKKTAKLKSGLRKNKEEDWIRTNRCFEPVVPPRLFYVARKIFESRTVFKTDEQLISDLEKIYQKYGYITSKKIDEAKFTYCPCTYHKRFGHLSIAFQLAGYTKKKHSTCEIIEGLRKALKVNGRLSTSIVKDDKNTPGYHACSVLFNGIDNAYLIAGYSAIKCTDEEMIGLLKKALKKHGRLSAPIIDMDKTLPSRGSIAYRFGSLANAYDKVGYKRQSMSATEMIEGLKSLLQINGRITNKMVSECPYLPATYVLVKQWGSMANAFRFAGYIPPIKTDEELLNGVRNLLLEKGKLSKKLIREDKNLAHPCTYVNRFGSIENVYKKVVYKKRIPKKILIDGLKRVLEKHGKITNNLIDEEPSIPSREYYSKVFGSLSKAYKLAGFRGHYMSDKEMLSRLKKLLKREGRLSKSIITKAGNLPSGKTYGQRFGGVLSAYKLIGYSKS